MNKKIKYLESLLPIPEEELSIKHFEKFEQYATYTGNGTYQWEGIRSSDTRELWLMGVLRIEGVKYEY